MNILYAASEATPFIKTGGLADVAGSLPKALCEKGHNVRVILPLYGKISDQFRDKMQFCLYTHVPLGWRNQYCGLFKLEHDGVTYYFIDNEYYFRRDVIYGAFDDAERFAFFSRAILHLLPLLDFEVDIINCNDWQTALIPIYLTGLHDPCYRHVRTVFTIHNIEYQGRYSPDTAWDVLGLPKDLYNNGIIRYADDINLMKGAIYQSSRVTTVSESYVQELRDPYFAHGLHKVIEDNAYKFSGIVNGIDVEKYDPINDKLIPKNFGPKSITGKRFCKQKLCRELGMDETDNGPIIACVSRLVGHKGFDLVADALEGMVERGLRIVVLGTGDKYFEGVFTDAEKRHKGRVSANIMYSEQRAMMIYAGADMMLMPSRSEPCGLTQMIAMRYGTVPIVRSVGGLKDTIRPYEFGNSNGFSFYDYSSQAMMSAIDYALQIWDNPVAWRALMKRDMTEDLSWSKAADKYLKVYEQARA